MKGVSVSIVITIIFVVLIILTIVAFIPTLKESTVTSYCKQEFMEKMDKIKYRSCEMSDVDLEYTEKVDTACIQQLENQRDNEKPVLLFKIKGSNKKYEYDTSCPSGFFGYVSFDFSLAGNEKELKIQKDSYSFLISPKKVKLIFCQGAPNDCETFNNNENGCKNQIGCSWDTNTKTCSGNPKSCYELNENECKQQKGCETA